MPRRPAAACAVVLLTYLGALGCSSTGDEIEATSLFVVPASLADLADSKFFDQPWPSDLRLENGSPRFEGYYNPNSILIYGEYIEAMRGVLDGFSPVASGFLRFTGPIDPSTLPADPGAATDAASSVQLIDIDPASPERGKRHLVSLSWRREEGVYWRANTLAFMPTLGFPLRGHTRYAIVVTDALRAEGGHRLGASEELAQILGQAKASAGPVADAEEKLAPALVELSRAGVDPARLVHLSVFTTADPTAELFAVRDAVAKGVRAPTAHRETWRIRGKNSDAIEYVGTYGPSPNFQEGKLPFVTYGDGGGFHIVDGKPEVVDLFDLRFSLTVPRAPNCPMPDAGYPIVLYAHGTGGDFRSYVHDGTARVLAQRCLASMGVDGIFHGARPGAPPDGDVGTIELLFFNFQNVVAARTNPRQSAIDEVQRARLFTESKLTVPASISATDAAVRFDASKLMFFGHSQGGLNGPLYLAADPSARGAVLSGSSSMISISLLEKTQPDPSVAQLVKSVFLALNEEQGAELSFFHPAMSLAQSITDVSDPIHYAQFDARSPRPGFAPKSIYMTEGINPDGTGDSYAPPHGIEVQGIAMGLPLQLPAQRPIVESQWGGPEAVEIPPEGISGNLAGGEASGVLAQWAVPPGDDGHFVVFDVPQATAQAAGFLQLLAADPKGRVFPP